MRTFGSRPQAGHGVGRVLSASLVCAGILACLNVSARAQETNFRGEPRVFKGHTNTVFAVTFSPDGKTLAAAGTNEQITLWEVPSGTEISPLKGLGTIVDFLVFSPDGKHLATVGRGENSVKLWNVTSGKEVAQFKGHSDRVNSIAFSPDGETLASASSDETVRL